MVNYIELLRNNPAYFKQFSCKELLFLNYDCPVKVKKLAKWSEHNYIYYVISGEKTIHTPGKSWNLRSGSAVFVKKGACVVEQFFREPFCIVVFILPDSFIKTFLEEHARILKMPVLNTSADDLVIPMDADEVMNAFYQSVLSYFTSETNPNENLIELKFKELLMNIVTNPSNHQLIAYMQSLMGPGASDIRRVMEMNYAYNLQLEEYAQLCNRSLSTFKRDFKIVYNMPPGKWLIQRRLEMARLLLIETDRAVADVCLECGFENNTHFSKAFRQRFGVSPMQYRKTVPA